MIHRRLFLGGLLTGIAAPAIVRASSLMPVRRLIEPQYLTGTEILARQRIFFESEFSRAVLDPKFLFQGTLYEMDTFLASDPQPLSAETEKLIRLGLPINADGTAADIEKFGVVYVDARKP